MATPVEMPKLGNTVEDCLLSTWLKHTGDTVTAGEVIAEIETDKTSFELAAPVDGVMLGTFFPGGALVPVFTVICTIGARSESVAGVSSPSTGGTAGSAEARVVAPAPDSLSVAAPGNGKPNPGTELALQQPINSADLVPAPAAPMSPRAKRFAREHDFHPASVQGRGPGGGQLPSSPLLGRPSGPASGGETKTAGRRRLGGAGGTSHSPRERTRA